MKSDNTKTRYSMLWSAPLFDPSGYAEDARNLILAADSVRIPVRANEVRWSQRPCVLEPTAAARLRELLGARISESIVNVCHIFPSYFVRAEGAVRNVGRTMFETDRLPEVWAAKCNEMDEIWVPSSFNVETFARSGVDLDRLRVLPMALDAKLYAKQTAALPFRDGLGFVFLSSFDWQLRKGWDLLLTAYCREFKKDKDVALVFKVYSSRGRSLEELQKMASDFVRDQIGMNPQEAPRILFLDDSIPSADMPSLYRSADCFVLPTRGEGWCRPFMESMACGVPVIGTRFGGHLDYMHEGNSLLLDCAIVPVSEEAVKEAPVFHKHRWAEPIVEHLRELMRQAFTDRKQMKQMGERARQEILSSYSQEAIGNRIASLIFGEEPVRRMQVQELAPSSQSASIQKDAEPASQAIRVQWEGSWFVNHSLSKINREIVSRLMEKPQLEFSLIPFERDEFEPGGDGGPHAGLRSKISKGLSGPADFVVRHRWPPKLEAPESGRWIWIQPWEYGSLPVTWAKTVRENVDEVWAPSQYVRRLYIEAGLNPDRVVVIPNGVDTKVFHPQAAPMTLPTTRRFRFLFVGGTMWRKGIDVLLTAYSAAFSNRDDVCLVIKDMGRDTFYRNMNSLEMIQRIQDSPGAPEIVYIDRTLSEQELAGLYTSCQLLVHPYRGEGFGMPVAEAMSCGLPVLVTQGGACDDFCDEENSYQIPARRRVLSDVGMETVGTPWVLEPDATILARRMREIVADSEGRKQKGERGRERVERNLSWERVAALVESRFSELISRPVFREQEWAMPEANTSRSDQGMIQKLQEAIDLLELYLSQHPEDETIRAKLQELRSKTGSGP